LDSLTFLDYFSRFENWQECQFRVKHGEIRTGIFASTPESRTVGSIFGGKNHSPGCGELFSPRRGNRDIISP
jgi:hypothetical protein